MVGFGLTVSAILAVATIGVGTHPPAPTPPTPPKPETRNAHCQISLMTLDVTTGEQMSATDRVNWCLAHGYGWDEYKPPAAAAPRHKSADTGRTRP